MKHISFLLSFVAIVSLPYFVWPSTVIAEDAVSVQELSGEILSVDPVEKTVVLKYTEGNEVEAELFNATAETKINKKQAAADFSSVKVGDKGTLSFSTDSGGKKNIVSLNLN